MAGGIAVAARGGAQTQPGTVVTAPGGPAAGVVAQPAPQATTATQPRQQEPLQPKSTLQLNMRAVELNIDGLPKTDADGEFRQPAEEVGGTVNRVDDPQALRADGQRFFVRTFLREEAVPRKVAEDGIADAVLN